MKTPLPATRRGFTLLETVIAIGVLAVLLTGFMVVFAPAAAGIKKAINVQEADRLASTLEQELTTWRKGNPGTTGFEKAFEWIMKSNGATPDDALLVYQYRGNIKDVPRTDDGTLKPLEDVTQSTPGDSYVVQPMLRRKSDSLFLEDSRALEGRVYLVKCTQLVFNNGELKVGTKNKIVDPKSGTEAKDADSYPEAVIAFSAEFYSLPGNSAAFFNGKGFNDAYSKAKTPVFTRNMAVRR